MLEMKRALGLDVVLIHTERGSEDFNVLIRTAYFTIYRRS